MNQESGDREPQHESLRLRRYQKQTRFSPIGDQGQICLLRASAVIVGCGALGSVIANTLARAGVGHLKLIDRDFVELDNLQRQVLYNESDVGQAKAVVARERLLEINRELDCEAVVTDVDFTNIESLIDSFDVVLDGTDNFETRFLINDACVKKRIPWVYGGCLGAEGQTMTILPGTTACLNCLMLDGPPPPGTTATCDSAGVLGPIINVIASIQSLEAIKLLSGNQAAVSKSLQVFDMWGNRSSQINVGNLRSRVDCPTCKRGEYQWLSGDAGSHSAILCGRNAVQLSIPDRPALDLQKLALRLNPLGTVSVNSFLLRFQIDAFTITVFPDSRAIINGTEDLAIAKRLYSQYVGV